MAHLKFEFFVILWLLTVSCMYKVSPFSITMVSRRQLADDNKQGAHAQKKTTADWDASWSHLAADYCIYEILNCPKLAFQASCTAGGSLFGMHQHT